MVQYPMLLLPKFALSLLYIYFFAKHCECAIWVQYKMQYNLMRVRCLIVSVRPLCRGLESSPKFHLNNYLQVHQPYYQKNPSQLQKKTIPNTKSTIPNTKYKTSQIKCQPGVRRPLCLWQAGK